MPPFMAKAEPLAVALELAGERGEGAEGLAVGMLPEEAEVGSRRGRSCRRCSRFPRSSRSGRRRRRRRGAATKHHCGEGESCEDSHARTHHSGGAISNREGRERHAPYAIRSIAAVARPSRPPFRRARGDAFPHGSRGRGEQRHGDRPAGGRASRFDAASTEAFAAFTAEPMSAGGRRSASTASR